MSGKHFVTGVLVRWIIIRKDKRKLRGYTFETCSGNEVVAPATKSCRTL